MQIYATFEYSTRLEIAITKLEKMGISEIFAVPLDNGPEDIEIFDTIHRSDGKSLLSKGMILAVFFSVIGASRGFKLHWGPIIWGLIGAAFGFILGFCIDLYIHSKKPKNRKALKGKTSEVIIIINCKDSEKRDVERILWEQLAVGVGRAE
ncbi:hypothetical protein [Heyndrickxia oleronia]|uniref:hypothetical protein n=1 Tax=Heyndrickxia oleronia TaxID=38875 RepID=UPI001AFE6CEF|nr:hypothetical protein [Heyndrickxia oleronia]GIN41222.1 hypothetical protein J19TS1_41710 [Heyndrickxia oleronia]